MPKVFSHATFHDVLLSSSSPLTANFSRTFAIFWSPSQTALTLTTKIETSQKLYLETTEHTNLLQTSPGAESLTSRTRVRLLNLIEGAEARDTHFYIKNNGTENPSTFIHHPSGRDPQIPLTSRRKIFARFPTNRRKILSRIAIGDGERQPSPRFASSFFPPSPAQSKSSVESSRTRQPGGADCRDSYNACKRRRQQK